MAPLVGAVKSSEPFVAPTQPADLFDLSLWTDLNLMIDLILLTDLCLLTDLSLFIDPSLRPTQH